MPDGVAYGLTEHERDAVRRRAAGRQPGLLSDRVAARAGAARRRRRARRRAPTSSSTRSRACPAPARRRRSGRTSRKCTAACRRTASSATATARRSSRASAAQVTFTPHLVPLDRGILATIYVRVAAGHDRGGAGRRLRARPTPARPSCGSSAPRCPRSSTSRTPISATSAGASIRPAARSSCRCIDNLLKGASGQAVQNMNVMLGLPRRPACCERPAASWSSSAASCSRSRIAAVRPSSARWRASQPPRTAGDRARRRQGDRRRAQGAPASRSGRSTACASPTTRRWTSSSRCWRARSTRGSSRRLRRRASQAVGLTGADAACGLSEPAPPHRSGRRPHRWISGASACRAPRPTRRC